MSNVRTILGLLALTLLVAACGESKRSAKAEIATASSLPAECVAHFERMSACAAKQPSPIREVLEQAVEQSKKASVGADKAQLAASCKAAAEAFAAESAKMNC